MFAVHDVGTAIAVHVAHRHSARLVAPGSVPAHPLEAARVVPVDCVRPAVAVGEHEVRVSVAVEVRGRYIDRRVVPRPERRPLAKGARPVPGEDEVLAPPVDHEDVRVPVAIEIGQRQTPRRTRSAEGGAGLEAARAVVEENEVARAVVPHRDIQVSVAIEIGERDSIGAGLFLPQPPREGEGGSPIIEVDPVLPGPVAAVGDDDIEGPVAVHVAQTSRRLSLRCPSPAA